MMAPRLAVGEDCRHCHLRHLPQQAQLIQQLLRVLQHHPRQCHQPLPQQRRVHQPLPQQQRVHQPLPLLRRVHLLRLKQPALLIRLPQQRVLQPLPLLRRVHLLHPHQRQRQSTPQLRQAQPILQPLIRLLQPSPILRHLLPQRQCRLLLPPPRCHPQHPQASRPW